MCGEMPREPRLKWIWPWGFDFMTLCPSPGKMDTPNTIARPYQRKCLLGQRSSGTSSFGTDVYWPCYRCNGCTSWPVFCQDPGNMQRCESGPLNTPFHAGFPRTEAGQRCPCGTSSAGRLVSLLRTAKRLSNSRLPSRAMAAGHSEKLHSRSAC